MMMIIIIIIYFNSIEIIVMTATRNPSRDSLDAGSGHLRQLAEEIQLTFEKIKEPKKFTFRSAWYQ